MSVWKLVFQSLFYYGRLNVALVVGVALTAAILSGSLVVGDSVKESLRRNAAARTQGIGAALLGGDRFFAEDLASRLEGVQEMEGRVAPVIQVLGTVATPEGGRRANGVQVMGVDERFWELGGVGNPIADKTRSSSWLAVNEVLARRLGVKVGDTLVVRLEMPGELSKDAPLSGEADETLTVRKKIDALITAENMGHYSLKAEQVPTSNVFLSLDFLQQKMEKSERANVLLVGGSGWHPLQEDLEKALDQVWNLTDASLQLSKVDDGKGWQLTSDRVFMDRSLAQAAQRGLGSEGSMGVLTYLVNEIRHGERSTPYSMVAATGGDENPVVPADLKEDEVVVTDWLAEDLGVKVGDRVEMTYFQMGDARQMELATSEFTVRSVIPLADEAVNRDWTPDFPGLADEKSMTMKDWKPGIAIDQSKIRDKDEKYWDDHRATPKAFISLQRGKEIWGNRFGELTAIRFSSQPWTAESFMAELRSQIKPSEFGLMLRDVSAESKAAVSQSMNFGALFASMSFFLIVAALILTALVFIFGVEQRRSQIGLFLALGMTSRRIRSVLLLEAGLLSMLGAALGLLGGWVYTQLALWGMSGAWQSAASGIEFVYYLKLSSLLMAWAVTVFIAVVVVYFASRTVMKVRPSQLISGGGDFDASLSDLKPLWKAPALWVTLIGFLAGLGCLLAPKQAGSMEEQGLFFGSGFLFTLAGVAACGLILRRLARTSEAMPSLVGLGRQNALRRKGRSLAVVGLMASGVFMVTAINSFRLVGERGADARSSGTGGFAYVGSATLPVYEDLNSSEGREKYGFSKEGSTFSMLSFRVSDGDDASCLNLNRAQRPRLLGVNFEGLAERKAFHFTKKMKGLAELDSGWEMLGKTLPDENGMKVIPGVIDMNTATYALMKGVGDLIVYQNSKGESFAVKLVGMLENSLLQGSIVISEKNFIQQRSDIAGYRYFLLDMSSGEDGKIVKRLTRMLEDRGVEWVPTAQRLNEFNAVQNTYLSIFSTLGGLGLLLGTVGLAVVVSRNVMERRGQLGLMQAVGFRRKDLAKMVLAEHWFLHVMGVLVGLSAALVSVAPMFMEKSSGLPIQLLLSVNLAVLIAGLLFCWLAARVVLKTPLMESLRTE
ncbi:MAG: ABC transporter permease [Verrucomicrobiales bacterium]|nr:ABC transporter permease [Verrucomicrobiales bacterium]